MEHPLEFAWNEEAESKRGAGERHFAMFYRGARRCIGWIALGQKTLLGPSGEETDWDTLVIMYEHIDAQQDPWDKLLATIKAHNG